jgi:hypothetical protein
MFVELNKGPVGRAPWQRPLARSADDSMQTVKLGIYAFHPIQASFVQCVNPWHARDGVMRQSQTEAAHEGARRAMVSLY